MNVFIKPLLITNIFTIIANINSKIKIMEVMEVDDVRTSFIMNDHYDLKIESKRLISGNFQVKFFARLKQKKFFYGYVLVDAASTLKEVVLRIRNKLCLIQSQKDFRQTHLYSIGKSSELDLDLNFIIFNQ
ncbi:MAG: hypothetical protein CBB92_06620 [Flammeovirgaceae bacterium TMED32]|nr:MAG: hypothetical protein CBB92_06620 [Flammeovirgaceae bacterium TMED32]|tara:strand:- start:1106 stop:1498 length:393 start_codon:yes stop_codon:yes gene_type:complete